MKHWCLFLLVSAGLLGSGCEKDVAINIPAGEEQLIVQGHIEPQAPPFVLITRTVPVFSGTDPAQLAAAFVHGAAVTVSHGGRIVELQETPVRDLPAAQQQVFREQFGLDAATLTNATNIPLAVYTTPDLMGEPGQTYGLRVAAEGKILTATTTIPQPAPLDSLWFAPHPNPANDSLVTLWYRYPDPDTLGNHIRYFTSRNRELFYPGYYASVFTDEFVNGQSINFPLERGHPKYSQVDNDTYSYFQRGDTVQVKWAALDFAHYRFWFTLEADRASNGNPFGFPTTIRSNINGGLGIWGGYGSSKHVAVSE